MIAYISGKLIEKSPTDTIIETGGIGYFINISLHTYTQIPNSENLKLYTHLHITEDNHSLYGFFDQQERQIFKLLISVSGIGTATARTMLSSMAPEQIKTAIISEDIKKITSIKGIGTKTAQRTVIELKDKMLKLSASEGGLSEIMVSHSIKTEAITALETLGFSSKRSESIVDIVLKDTPDIDIEQLIKESLKKL